VRPQPPATKPLSQNTWMPLKQSPSPKFQLLRHMSQFSHAFLIRLPNNGIEWLTHDISQRLHSPYCSSQSPKPGPPSPHISLVLPRAKFNTLKMEAASSYETFLHVYCTTWNQTPSDNILHILNMAADRMFGETSAFD
jgi:hypothetical protein